LVILDLVAGNGIISKSVFMRDKIHSLIDPADELYDAIRASETDVGTIAANTGIKPQNIQKVTQT
jgi:hypothetical protein